MDDIRKMLKAYRIEEGDIENLKSMAPLMDKYKEPMTEALIGYILSREETARFFPDEEIQKRHKEAVQGWFMRLFSGEYDSRYLLYLQRIGQRHVKEGIDVHYMLSAMNLIRTFTIDIIEKEIECPDMVSVIASVNKIIDFNLDAITTFYREEELRTTFVSYRFEGYLIEFAKRFTYGLNLILVVALILISFSVIGLFVYDIGHLLEGNVVESLISAIGTLLILWVMIELLGAEVRHLRGGKFAIKIFVGVALVSLIRELLISSFKETGGVEKQYFFAISILILGVVYWLISRTET